MDECGGINRKYTGKSRSANAQLDVLQVLIGIVEMGCRRFSSLVRMRGGEVSGPAKVDLT